MPSSSARVGARVRRHPLGPLDDGQTGPFEDVRLEHSAHEPFGRARHRLSVRRPEDADVAGRLLLEDPFAAAAVERHPARQHVVQNASCNEVASMQSPDFLWWSYTYGEGGP